MWAMHWKSGRWVNTNITAIHQNANNCIENILHLSMIVFLFSKRVHFIDCIFRSMIDELSFYHSRLRTTAMFLRVSIWKLNWKQPWSAFRIFCLAPFKATGQWITWISMIRLCSHSLSRGFSFQSSQAKILSPPPGFLNFLEF